MTNKIISVLFIALIFSISCKKDKPDDPQPVDTVTEAEVLTDFANVLAIPNYADLFAKATTLNTVSIALSASITDQHLAAAQDAWRAVRQSWEQAEAFLIGPVSDFDYDPATDSWPVNTVELDSLLSSSNPLEVENIDSLQFTLKGYHPIEYVLFGVGGTRTAAQLTARELKYLTSLTQSLANTLSVLVLSWDINQPGNFTIELFNPGTSNSRFTGKRDVFLAIVDAMSHICEEVATGKMEEPFAAQDSEIVESQYAHNATIDFMNNIKGVQNVYMCRYTSTGRSLHNLVSQKDLSLDNSIQTKITNALNALAVINPNYGVAIFTQQNQILIAQNAINDLSATLDQLSNFVQINITD